jgi:hypothetical protein
MFEFYRALGPTELNSMAEKATFQGLSVLLLKFKMKKRFRKTECTVVAVKKFFILFRFYNYQKYSSGT